MEKRHHFSTKFPQQIERTRSGDIYQICVRPDPTMFYVAHLKRVYAELARPSSQHELISQLISFKALWHLVRWSPASVRPYFYKRRTHRPNGVKSAIAQYGGIAFWR